MIAQKKELYNSKVREIAQRHRGELHPEARRELKLVHDDENLPAPLRQQAAEVLSLRQGNGRAVRLDVLREDPELTQPPQFHHERYTAVKRSALISVGPKVGKTTYCAHYATATARGDEWLGQKLEQKTVFWCGPDEYVGDVVARFDRLGAPADRMHVWKGLAPEIEELAKAVADVGAGLVVVDTWSRVARVKDENDNAEVSAWFDRALPLVRSSDAAWLWVHHDRKSGGKHGEGIRGASAILGSVDIAFSLQRVDNHPNRRLLQIEGSRYEIADPVVIELQGDQYVRLGEARRVKAEESNDLSRVRTILTADPLRVAELLERYKDEYPDIEAPARSTLSGWLHQCVSHGWARREGEGNRRDPYRYADR